MNRKEFLEAVIPVSVALLAACRPASPTRQPIEPVNKVDQQLQEYRSRERELEPLIDRFEKGFAAFGEEALQRIARSDIPVQDRSILLNPIEIFKINQQNGKKNVFTSKREDLERRRSLDSGAITIPNPNFYFYGILTLNQAESTSFVPASRTLEVSRQYDPNNLLDNLSAFHNLIHVAQDNDDRETVSQDAYHQYYVVLPGSKPKALPRYEASAYAAEVHLLDLFTNGEFRKEVIKAEGNIDTAKFRKQLRAREDQELLIAILGQIACKYYTTLPSLSGIHRDFLNFIADNYRAQGFDIYDRNQTGYFKVESR